MPARVLLSLLVGVLIASSEGLDIHALSQGILIQPLPGSTRHSDGFSFLQQTPLRERSRGRGLKQGRGLTNSGGGACFWDHEEDICEVGTTGALQLLEQADNPVAEYVYRLVECNHEFVEEGCISKDCLWHAGRCHVPEEEYRNFHSAKCLRQVEHIVQLRAGEFECLPKPTERSCSDAKRCYWYKEGCHFDRWQYFHGIPTVNGTPETFNEVFAERRTQVAEFVQEVIDSTENPDWDEVLDMRMPRFDCPAPYEEVMCEYVDAFTDFMRYRLYCRLHYTSSEDVEDCNDDPHCTAISDGDHHCDISAELFTEIYRDAELDLVDTIEDSDARFYEQKRVECQLISDSDECSDEEECSWSTLIGSCGLSNKWVEEEIYRLIGKSNNPVCQLFSLGGRYSCLEIEEEEECREDPQCDFYGDYCDASRLGQVEHAMDSDEMSDMFKEMLETCELSSSERSCAKVTISHDSHSHKGSESRPHGHRTSSELRGTHNSGEHGHRPSGNTGTPHILIDTSHMGSSGHSDASEEAPGSVEEVDFAFDDFDDDESGHGATAHSSDHDEESHSSGGHEHEEESHSSDGHQHDEESHSSGGHDEEESHSSDGHQHDEESHSSGGHDEEESHSTGHADETHSHEHEEESHSSGHAEETHSNEHGEGSDRETGRKRRSRKSRRKEENEGNEDEGEVDVAYILLGK